jgi:hypothetical protein
VRAGQGGGEVASCSVYSWCNITLCTVVCSCVQLRTYIYFGVGHCVLNLVQLVNISTVGAMLSAAPSLTPRGARTGSGMQLCTVVHSWCNAVNGCNCTQLHQLLSAAPSLTPRGTRTGAPSSCTPSSRPPPPRPAAAARRARAARPRPARRGRPCRGLQGFSVRKGELETINIAIS